jgi:hypothetical protein
MAVTGTPQSGSSLGACTTDDVKTRLSISDSEYDVMIAAMIAGLTGRFDAFCGRTLLQPAGDVTEYYTGGSPYMQLNRYPVIAITSVKEAWDRDFDNATALTADDDYWPMNGGKNGIIHRNLVRWPVRPDSIQVIYRGGYAAAGEEPGAGEIALPPEIREAAIMQATFIFKRRDDIGLSAVGFEGGSMSKFAAMKLLPDVEKVLVQYRRPSL